MPDVSGDADPASGYSVRVDGKTFVIGGTSAVAPLWAGLIAVANAANGKSAGFINPTIYAIAGRAKYTKDFHDITSGTSGKFSATPVYDLVTGLGSPSGDALIRSLVDGS